MAQGEAEGTAGRYHIPISSAKVHARPDLCPGTGNGMCSCSWTTVSRIKFLVENRVKKQIIDGEHSKEREKVLWGHIAKGLTKSGLSWERQGWACEWQMLADKKRQSPRGRQLYSVQPATKVPVKLVRAR